MITVYHNPRCSKSRGACELISDVYNPSNEPVEVVEYLRTPLSVAQLKELNQMLGCPVREMIRDSEAIYKELDLADASLTDDQLYEAIAANPILLQRPIEVNANILQFLKGRRPRRHPLDDKRRIDGQNGRICFLKPTLRAGAHQRSIQLKPHPPTARR